MKPITHSVYIILFALGCSVLLAENRSFTTKTTSKPSYDTRSRIVNIKVSHRIISGIELGKPATELSQAEWQKIFENQPEAAPDHSVAVSSGEWGQTENIKRLFVPRTFHGHEVRKSPSDQWSYDAPVFSTLKTNSKVIIPDRTTIAISMLKNTELQEVVNVKEFKKDKTLIENPRYTTVYLRADVVDAAGKWLLQ